MTHEKQERIQGQGGATHTPRESAIGFLVRFENVGAKRLNWEERVERPVSNDKIVKAVKRKKALFSRGVDAESTSDYGGIITAGHRTVGSYLIVPGSEVAESPSAPVKNAGRAALRKAGRE